MAATISVTCPECDTTVKASAAMEGKRVRCRSCGSVFTVHGAPAGAATGVAAKPGAKAAPRPARPAKEPAAKATPAAEDDDADDDGNPYGITDIDLSPRCPHCANDMESATAIICLHCGYNTVTREQGRTKKLQDQTAVDILVWLLPGILCVLGIIGIVVWDVLYCMYIEDWIDTDTWYGTALAHMSVKMWMCIMSVFMIYAMGKFAVIRLIFDRIPPEVEKH
jgi:predicted Zn finger-like uncharacterized protein